jgi:hypothetical protein
MWKDNRAIEDIRSRLYVARYGLERVLWKNVRKVRKRDDGVIFVGPEGYGWTAGRCPGSLFSLSGLLCQSEVNWISARALGRQMTGPRAARGEGEHDGLDLGQVPLTSLMFAQLRRALTNDDGAARTKALSSQPRLLDELHAKGKEVERVEVRRKALR